MAKWKTVRISQELISAVEKTLDRDSKRTLSEFVSEAIQMRLADSRQVKEETSERSVHYPILPERLLCSSNHIWTMVTPEGTIRIGLTYYSQGRLKGVLSLHTEPVGSEVNRERPFGFAETWMFKFYLYAPVSGKIAKLNRAVKEKPSMINEDPYAGWIAEIEPSNIVALEEELRDMMSPKQYKMWAAKLRHFPRVKPRTFR